MQGFYVLGYKLVGIRRIAVEHIEVSRTGINAVVAQVRDLRYISNNLYPNYIIRHMLTK